MNDVEDDDDAHYPPTNPTHHRHKPPPQFNQAHHLRPPSYSESDDSDDQKIDQDSDDDEEEEENNHSASSPESRGKRRKLDHFALGFEFAPRKLPPPHPPPPVISTVPLNSKSKKPPEWSEDSTFVLLDSWGDLFVQNDRKSLRSDEWSEVGKKVNSHSSLIVRSDSQCRNRLDTLKKKYKKEKFRLAAYPGSKSDWIYFKKMDYLMSVPVVAVAETGPVRLPCGVDAGEYVFSSSRVLNSRVSMNQARRMEEMRDSPMDTGSEDDESDGLPPATATAGKMRRGEGSGSFRMLADSIRKFGEIYEKIEIGKRQQMVELERMRNELQRDLEVQKRQIMERAQAEITRMRQEEAEGRRTDDGGDDDDDGGDDDDGDEDDDIDGSGENMSG